MGIFNRTKTEKTEKAKKAVEKKPESVVEKKSTAVADLTKEKKETSVSQSGKTELKGKSQRAYRALIKPLVTEKASSVGVLNKYIFLVDPKINKVEIKKAIRSIYNVEPIKVNVANFAGRTVRYGRMTGQTKAWKKAVVTLKPGDKIEIYEGV